MKDAKCRQSEALARTFPRPPDATLAAHLESCATCQAAWQSLAELRTLGQLLPSEQPSDERRDAVRARLLYQAERLRQQSGGLASPPPWPARSTRWLPWLGLAAALLLVVGLTWRAGRPFDRASQAAAALAPAAGPRAVSDAKAHASLRVIDAADYQTRRQGGTEIVHLRHGRIELSVRPLAIGERFLVAVGGSEVEVRGTLFAVSAEHDRLTAVQVSEGRVEVRPASGSPIQLTAGQAWTLPDAALAPSSPATDGPGVAPKVTDRSPSRSDGAPTARRVVQPPGTQFASPASDGRPGAFAARPPQPGQPSPGGSAEPPAAKRGKTAEPLGSPAERAFTSGFAALKLGQFAAAAADLDRAVALSPGGNLAEDARFWSSVAWARAGKTREAAGRLRSFLAHHPRSPRGAEVAAALGWILIRDHRLDEAERVLRAAGAGRSPEVSESIRSGLAAIAAARATP
jgi:TolA-binding protein